MPQVVPAHRVESSSRSSFAAGVGDHDVDAVVTSSPTTVTTTTQAFSKQIAQPSASLPGSVAARRTRPSPLGEGDVRVSVDAVELVELSAADAAGARTQAHYVNDDDDDDDRGRSRDGVHAAATLVDEGHYEF